MLSNYYECLWVIMGNNGQYFFIIKYLWIHIFPFKIIIFMHFNRKFIHFILKNQYIKNGFFE